jgi:hypothetical protein
MSHTQFHHYVLLSNIPSDPKYRVMSLKLFYKPSKRKMMVSKAPIKMQMTGTDDLIYGIVLTTKKNDILDGLSRSMSVVPQRHRQRHRMMGLG